MFQNFRAFIIDELGRSYYRKPTGEADTTSTATPVPDMYEGWGEMEVGYERDTKLFGLKRSFTLPVSLIKATKWLIRWIVFAKSEEEKLFLLITKLKAALTGSSYDLFYDYWYKGKVDLTTFRYKDDRDSVSIIEAGTKETVEKSDNTTYEIDLDSDTERVVLYYEGLELRSTKRFQVVASQGLRNTEIVPLVYLPSEDAAAYIGGLTQQINGTPTDQFFLSNTGPIPVTVNLVGSLTFRCNPFTQQAIAYLSKYGGTAPYADIQVDTFNPAGTGDHTVNYNQTISLQANEKLVLRLRVFGTNTTEGNFAFYSLSDWTVTYKTRYQPTFVNSLRPATLAQGLAAKMGLTLSDIDVTWLKGFDNLLLTSGDGLRSLKGAKIKTSLSDFTEFVRVICAGGRGVENNVLLFQDRAYFLNPVSPIHLGEAAKCEVFPANEFKGNLLEVGYRKQQIDDVNGKYSFHNTYQRTTPSSVDGKISLVSPYLACPFYAEVIRLNLEGRETTDDSADTEVFIFNTDPATFTANTAIAYAGGEQGFFISGNIVNDMAALLFQGAMFTTSSLVNPGPFTVSQTTIVNGNLQVYTLEPTTNEVLSNVVFTLNSGAKLKRITYDNVQGVPEPATIFNIEQLTQYRIMQTQAKLLNSMFSSQLGKTLVYTSTDKNADFSTTKNGVTITESADFLIGADKLFKAWWIEISVRTSENLVSILETRPNAPFSFDWYGDTYTGFGFKVVVSANDSRQQSIRLLATPDCDLTKLIKPIYG